MRAASARARLLTVLGHSLRLPALKVLLLRRERGSIVVRTEAQGAGVAVRRSPSGQVWSGWLGWSANVLTWRLQRLVLVLRHAAIGVGRNVLYRCSSRTP